MGGGGAANGLLFRGDREVGLGLPPLMESWLKRRRLGAFSACALVSTSSVNAIGEVSKSEERMKWEEGLAVGVGAGGGASDGAGAGLCGED